MAIENTISNYFWSTFVDSINVFDFRLSDVFYASTVCSLQIRLGLRSANIKDLGQS